MTLFLRVNFYSIHYRRDGKESYVLSLLSSLKGMLFILIYSPYVVSKIYIDIFFLMVY